uniref:Retroelement silencing factor 1 n=1 Tax=Catagonus wagneri TaxID=51154 RepID=A0A8C3WQT8_9CETA
MNWNMKPESVTLPPQYPRKQTSFLEQALVSTLATASQGPLNHPGSNQEACLFLSNSNPVSQPLLNIRNYKTPQQIPISDRHSGTIVTSQTSVERITYTNVKGPKQLNHDLQMSSGVRQDVWLNSPMRNSMLSHTGATVSHQTGFGTNPPSVHALQNQFVTSDTYSMQLQMMPSNSGRAPVTYQDNPRLNPPLSEQQVDWTQQCASSGLVYPNYRPLPKQYGYSSRSFVQDPALQKQNTMSSVSLQDKNSPSPNPAFSQQSKQMVTVPSYQYAVVQTDERPPPPYDCRYASQPLPSVPHVVKRSSMDVPQNQEMYLPEMGKDFCRGFQQQWRNPNENFSTMENTCNLKGNTSVGQPFNKPVGSSLDSVQALGQNIQEKRVDSRSLTSNQALDTRVTKEKLVRDFKTLVEIKKKFSDLARKIKINKSLLMAAGCIKTANSAYSDSAQNSQLSLKQTANIQYGPQVTIVTPETMENKSPAVMESAEVANKTRSILNSNLQDRHFNQVSSVLLNSVHSEKLPVPEQLHDLKVVTSSKTSPVEVPQATSNNAQFSSRNFVSITKNVPTRSETTSLPQFMTFEEYISDHPNQNRLVLSLLAPGGKIERKLLKDITETVQDSKLHSSERNPNTHNTGNVLNLKTVETPSTCKIHDKISDGSSESEQKSLNGMSSKSDSHFSMELLATCLSLWKKQPSEESSGEKQCNESKPNTTAAGVSKPMEIYETSPFSAVGTSQSKVNNSSQEAVLSMVTQNYESSGSTTTKGIAVVSPLILSDVRTLSVKGITPETLPEAAYPVIKEGSICSLQNKSADTTAALKVSIHEPVTSTTSTKIFPLIQKEKQSESTNANSEGTPNTSPGKHNETEPNSQCPVSDQQTSYVSKDSDVVHRDVLQIGNICSLVEGDTSYSSQIAKIFNLPPLEKVEQQKASLPHHQAVSSRQPNEQVDNIAENQNLDFQKDTVVQCTDTSHETIDQSQPLQPPESPALKYIEAKSGILEESSLEQIAENGSLADDVVASAATQQDSCPQETDMSCGYTAQDPTKNELLDDETSILYLQDQLSELLKEFPYGIEPVNMHEGCVVQQVADPPAKPQTCEQTSDPKNSTDQIQITILNSEQMKELFAEQEGPPSEVDASTEPLEEKPVAEEGDRCDPQARAIEEGCESVILDSEKDDVRCCALGWLSMVYEGVPQCHCNSIKNSASEQDKEKDPCSPPLLEANSYKQGEGSCDGDGSVTFKNPPDNLRLPLTLPVEEKHLPETEQCRNINDPSETEHNGSPRTEKELPGQFLCKGDKKDPLQIPRKKALKFHQVIFQAKHKSIKICQESLQRKLIAQNLHPFKPKMGFLTSKNKDSHVKNGSLPQSASPEKRKLKAGGSKHKGLEKRKLEEGSLHDSDRKRKKCDKQEQNKNAGSGTFKFYNLSTPSERAMTKERTVSNVKSSGSKDSSSRNSRVLTTKEYLARQKRKEAVSGKTLKKNCLKNLPCDSQYVRSSKLPVPAGSCGKSKERQNSSVQTSKESLHTGSNHGQTLKTHHSKDSKTCLSRNVKGAVGGRTDKTKPDKNFNSVNNEAELSPLSSRAKDQRKTYLNRVGFKCTERERICLTKLDGSPRKLNKEKKPENKPKNRLPGKDSSETLSMLEFKLCPDGLFKNPHPVEDQKDLQPCPRKKQSPVQVSGIKSTKEDWLKCVPEEKRTLEANQEIDDVLANSRLAKRSFSADGFERQQNPVKDSKTMFQTYKKMYMEKRSRSLGSSPLK